MFSAFTTLIGGRHRHGRYGLAAGDILIGNIESDTQILSESDTQILSESDTQILSESDRELSKS